MKNNKNIYIKDKYGLLNLKMGESLDFNLNIYSKLRLACHFKGQAYNRFFSTNKVGNKIKVIRRR